MVEVSGASCNAGGAVILDDVTARFRTGVFNVILGPNGAGKSTLLKVAAGLLHPTRGSVTYGGRRVGDFTAGELARRRAVLSQHVELAFPLPVRDVVLMGRYPHYGRVPSEHDMKIVDRALDMVGMQDRRAQHYTTLSGGEQQKVQLARVLAQIWANDSVSEHKYLFLDEPTARLDVHYQLHLLDVARELLAHNCTVVAILHDLNVALHYGDAFFIMDGGRVVKEADAPSDISTDLIERVFRVRAHRVTDPSSNEEFWRFAL